MGDMLYKKAIRIMEEVGKGVKGKESCVRKALSAILAGGHILIEDFQCITRKAENLYIVRVR